MDELDDIFENNNIDNSVILTKKIALITDLLGASGIATQIADYVLGKIPNQRLDRIIDYIKNLESRVKELELKDAFNLKIKKDDAFNEMVLDSIVISQKVLTKKRRGQLVNLILSGLKKDLESINTSFILQTFDNLNEVEIIILYLYYFDGAQQGMWDEKQALLKANNEIFKYDIWTHHDGSRANEQEVQNRNMYLAYKAHLSQLGLIEIDPRDHIENKRLQITGFGKLFIDFIGFKGS